MKNDVYGAQSHTVKNRYTEKKYIHGIMRRNGRTNIEVLQREFPFSRKYMAKCIHLISLSPYLYLNW